MGCTASALQDAGYNTEALVELWGFDDKDIELIGQALYQKQLDELYQIDDLYYESSTAF